MENRLDSAADEPTLDMDPRERTANQGSDASSELIDPKSTELSTEFVGRWSTLISTTNWEKGRIIHQWRQTLLDSEAAPATFSDEAWSRRVGGVTPQHVGRLRRVFERFADSYESYPGLFWSHFLAAIDWDDAEMWLEGAVQSKWSISQMRQTRWESMGAPPEDNPAHAELMTVGDDEDYTPLAEAGTDKEAGQGDAPRSVAEGPRYDDPDFGDEDDNYSASAGKDDDDDDLPWQDDAATAISPFAKIPSLPVDLAEAVEQFKLAIIRHRSTSWSEVSQRDVELALDALKTFVNL
ncbi:MAG: hypothetical protein R3C53_16680 [Pirellulaceae bacterium]